jgi:type II secretory pathway pseudopilin PulG
MKNELRGQSLLEVVLVTFLFGILGTGLLATLLSSSVISSRGVEYSLGSGYIQEAIEAVRSIRARDWSELTNGTHGLTTSSGYYDFAGTSDSLDNSRFTRTITIEDVYRTGSLTGDIAVSGIFDAATKRVMVNVTWEVPAGLTKNIDAVFYVTNWDQESWVQTLTGEFEAGFENSTDMATAANGEVVLRTHNADWEEVEILHELDLSGGGDRFVTYADPDSDVLYALGADDGGDNFHAIDISDVSEHTPTVIGSREISNVNDFVVQDGYAYLAAHESGPGGELLVLEVPSMTTVTTLNLPGSESANGIDIFGETIVLVRQEDNNDDEVVFYNVSNPASPVLLGGADTNNYSLTDVAYNGSYAFAVSNDASYELTAVRQSDFSVVDTLNLAGSSGAGAIDWHGTNVYVGLNSNGSGYELAAINAADPSNLLIISTIEVSQSVERIQVDTNGQYAAAATRLDGKNLFMVDLSTFAEAHSGDLSGGSQAESGSVFGGHGYLGSTSSTQDVVAYRVSPGGWSDAERVSSADLSGNHDESSIWISGNYAYQATENNGVNHDFFIYDISTPASPTYLGSIDSNSDINDVVISGNYAYLATKDNSREMIVIDITTKTSPQIVGSYNASGSRDGISVALSGTTLYLGREDGSDPEFYVFSLANPAAPTFAGSTHYGENIERMVASGSYVYAATRMDSEELAVFDVSNPAAPLKVAGLDITDDEDGQAIAVSGTLLALGRADGGGPELAIVNIVTPTSPQLLGSAHLNDEVNGVAFDGTSFVHTAGDDWQAQYQRWDITNPALPTLDAFFDLTIDGEGIFFNGVLAFVATESNTQELQIIGPGNPPTDYAREGNFTSQAFDAGGNVSWDSLEWTTSGVGSVTFRIRTADTQAHLATARWVGPDGASETVFNTWGQTIIEDPSATGRRWFQWKASLTGNGSSTPSLEDVTVRYSQ